MKIQPKPFEIFCGTGGVGKTTLSTSRAVYLARKGKKVLLVTIDPAKRLRDLLGIDQEQFGEIVSVQNFSTAGKLDALLMLPEKTIQRIATLSNQEDLSHNRIVKILTRPFGGMNEILAVIEVQLLIEKHEYDVIILDTPPGGHFLDFLGSLDKIRNFFNKSFIEIFTSLGRDKAGKSLSLFGSLLKKSVQKLLSYLEKVTGADFVDDFLNALHIIYQSKEGFLKGLEFQETISKRDKSNWFLVTSAEQGKLEEALELKREARKIVHQDFYLLLNKSLHNIMTSWTPQTPAAQKLKAHVLKSEGKLESANVVDKLHFDEVISTDPHEHVNQLAEQWRTYELSN